MVALKDMISHPEALKTIDSLPTKKRKHEKYTVYEQVDVPTVYGKKQLHFSDMGTPSKAELQELLDKDFEGTISSIKEIQKKALREALEKIDFSDVLADIDYVPTHSQNKIIHFTKKFDDKLKNGLQDLNVEEFATSVNFSKKKLEEKIYTGVVSKVDKDSVTVLLGTMLGQPLTYVLPYNTLSPLFQKKQFRLGDQVFLDLKKNENQINLASRSAFEQQRNNELKSLGIEINGYKPVFYMTKSGKSFKGKVVGFGKDITGQQIVFETKEGKKFPLTIENLKKGMDLAKESYRKEKNKEVQQNNRPSLERKPAPILIKKSNIREREVA